MPLIRTIQIYPEKERFTKLGIWHLTEPEAFFRKRVNPVREALHPHKRLQHLAARYLLRELEADFPVNEILISPSRKPYLADNTIHFSLAHCGDYAAAIISSKYRVGIDVEGISPKIERVADKFLNERERAFLDNERRREHLTVCWSAKEAVYKWYGDGGIDFRQHMHLQPFALHACGSIQCRFSKDGIWPPLHLFYQIDGELVLAWLVDDHRR